MAENRLNIPAPMIPAGTRSASDKKLHGCRDRKLFLALEVMEECNLGNACCLPDIIHRGCRVALDADDVHGARQDSFILALLLSGITQNLPTGFVWRQSGLPALWPG